MEDVDINKKTVMTIVKAYLIVGHHYLGESTLHTVRVKRGLAHQKSVQHAAKPPHVHLEAMRAASSHLHTTFRFSYLFI